MGGDFVRLTLFVARGFSGARTLIAGLGKPAFDASNLGFQFGQYVVILVHVALGTVRLEPFQFGANGLDLSPQHFVARDLLR